MLMLMLSSHNDAMSMREGTLLRYPDLIENSERCTWIADQKNRGLYHRKV